jgi:hypothetical protein
MHSTLSRKSSSGSRDQYNQNRGEVEFRRNFRRLFGFGMPHGKSAQNVIALLNTEQIKALKYLDGPKTPPAQDLPFQPLPWKIVFSHH